MSCLLNDHTATFCLFHIIPKVFIFVSLCFRMMMTMSYVVLTSGAVLETVLVHFTLGIVFRVGAVISPLWWMRKPRLRNS